MCRWCVDRSAVLSVRFEVRVSLFLAPAGADKRSPKAPFPLVENAGIQPAIRKRVPAGALAGAGSYWKHWIRWPTCLPTRRWDRILYLYPLTNDNDNDTQDKLSDDLNSIFNKDHLYRWATDLRLHSFCYLSPRPTCSIFCLSSLGNNSDSGKSNQVPVECWISVLKLHEQHCIIWWSIKSLDNLVLSTESTM